MAQQEQDIFLCLGSNQGDRAGQLLRACELIGQEVGPITCRSSIYETEPWGMESVDPFLNQVIQVSSILLPVELLGVLQGIERELGRSRMPDAGCRIPDAGCRIPDAGCTSQISRPTSYVSRSIDIDILFYGDEIVEMPELTIPHPLIEERRFVLVPLAEIAPELVHQVLGKDMKQLLEHCVDSGKVSVWEVKT